MLDFRKLLAVASLASALSVSAFGQGANPINFPGDNLPGASQYVSLEGTTEILPDIVFSNPSNNTYTAAAVVTFTLTANVPFTNTVVNTTTGALDVTATDSNGDKGVVTQTSPLVVTVTFPTFATPNPNLIPPSTYPITITTITIGGLRVNASQVPSPTITIAPGVLPGGEITFNGGTTAQTAAFPVPTLSSVATEGYVNQPLATFTNTPSGTTTIEGVVAVSFNAAQFVLLKTAAGYTSDGGATPIAATQGTRVQVQFNNLNANVNYWVPATIGTNVTLTAYTAATGNTAATATTFTSSLGSVTLVPLPAPVNGQSTIYYGVTGVSSTGAAVSPLGGTAGASGIAEPAAPATFPVSDLILSETVPTPNAVTTVSSVPPTATLSLVGVSTGYPQFSSTAGTYTATQTSSTNASGIITLNSTTILFPYVTNTGGYDTGVAITNASTLPKGVSAGMSTTASSAACSVTFYGTGAPSTNPYLLGVITTGTISTFDVGTVAPGFSGYVVVTCNFEGAHGYAFITNGLGTGTGVAANYLGAVIAAPGLGVVTAE